MFYEQARDRLPVLDIPGYLVGRDSLLEPLWEFLLKGYTWRGIVVPRAALAVVPGLGQVEDRATLLPGSYLLALAGACTQADGFRFSIFDHGTQRMAVADRYVDYRAGADVVGGVDAWGHVLAEPYYVVAPGLLQVKVVNLSAAANDMQLLLHFAVPGVDRPPKELYV